MKHIWDFLDAFAAAWDPKWPPHLEGSDQFRMFLTLRPLAETLEQLPRALAELIATMTLLRTAPPWASGKDFDRAANLIKDAVQRNPSATPTDLLRMVAADAIWRRQRGRHPQWTGAEGARLVKLVDLGLQAMGLTRRKKGLCRVIAEIRAADPRRYGKWSEERLRKAYYDGRRAQSGKALD